jgi:transposase
MEFFGGVDLGKRKSHIRVIDKDRRVIEDLKIENDPKAFARVFRKYGKAITVACEASSNAFWVWDTLTPMVKQCLVGHTSKIRWIAEARIKTDKIDAGILAELVRADLFPSISIPPKRVRELRELARGLVRMRRQTTRFRNQVHGVLGRHGVPYQRAETAGKKLGELVGTAGMAAPAQQAAESFLAVEAATLQQEKALEGALRKELKGEERILGQIRLLESVPGVGFFSAALLILELWDPTRFRDAKHLASYIGFVPGTHQTGETMWHGRMTRTGNKLIRWILVQDAWVAVRTHWYFGKLYERFRKKKGAARAIVPVARALLNTILRVWTQGKTYEEVFAEKTLVG